MTQKRLRPCLIMTMLVLAGAPLAGGCQASAEMQGGGAANSPPPPPPPPPPVATHTAVVPPPPAAAEPAKPIKPPASGSVSGSKVTIPGNIVYETGKATLKPESEPVLTQLKQFLDDNPQVTVLRIEGHTDSDGDDAMNLKLSGERALSCVTWLATHGISRDRLIAVGFGETHPIKPNDTKENKEQNRRTEFHIAVLNGKNFLGRDPTSGGTVFKLFLPNSSDPVVLASRATRRSERPNERRTPEGVRGGFGAPTPTGYRERG